MSRKKTKKRRKWSELGELEQLFYIMLFMAIFLVVGIIVTLLILVLFLN